jgi:hypothetical protein
VAEIYWLIDPETRKPRYVGSAASTVKRIRSHWYQRNSKYRSPVKDWLQSLVEPPEFEVVDTVLDEQRLAAEAYWTKMLRETRAGPDLLNVLDGRKMRSGTRKKIGAAFSGKTLTESHRRKISISRQNVILKLSSSDIEAIRASSLRPYRLIAEQYGVDPSTIGKIIRSK